MAVEGLQLFDEKMGKAHFGRAPHGEKSGPRWRGLSVVQQVLGLCALSSGTGADEPLQARKGRHGSQWKNC